MKKKIISKYWYIKRSLHLYSLEKTTRDFNQGTVIVGINSQETVQLKKIANY